MGAHRLSESDVRAAFPAGTVLHNPVTGEYARVLEHTAERAVGELLAVPGAAVAGPHFHPAQEERFEVEDGVMGYRLGDHRGELRTGGAVTVPAGEVHDWWNAGDGNLRARVSVTPPGLCGRRSSRPSSGPTEAIQAPSPHFGNRDRRGDSIGSLGPDPLLDETFLARGTDVYARLARAC